LLADYLVALRRAAGLTQEQLGAQLGYGQNSISNIETGRQRVSAAVLALWLDVCRATADQRIEALALAVLPAPTGDSAGTL
jgi:transcriptional regulator with XRE-family HTH domain